MKIKSVRIQNFRSFEDETIEFGSYTSFVGPNGAGKSNVLCALNIFFRETANAATDLTLLEAEDFHLKRTQTPIRITVTFDELSEEAATDFQEYYRQGVLVVTSEAKFDAATGKAIVKQAGERLGMVAFKPFFGASGDGTLVSELKVLYAGLKQQFADLPVAGTKPAMVEALKSYEAARPQDCALIPSQDEFYGFSKGANRLSKYIQWVFVPAVKHAAEEQQEDKNSALGRLLSRTVRRAVNFSDEIAALRESTRELYKNLLADKQAALTGISDSLKARLHEWAHPDTELSLDWNHDPDKSVQVQEPFAQIFAGEAGFLGTLTRCGHGLQRSYLLALLQELAAGGEGDMPTLILACEEPELFQHPPQARHMSGVLQKVAEQGSQVIVCSHSPYFINGLEFESVRIVRKANGSNVSRVRAATLTGVAARLAAALGNAPVAAQGILAKIHQELQPTVNEIFFAPSLVLVEGLEDSAYIKACLLLENKWDDFRKLGMHIVPIGGKSSIIKPLAVLEEMGIPSIVVFDSDADDTHPDHRIQHERDNRALLRLCGLEAENPLPTSTVWSARCVMWHSEITKVIVEDWAGAPLQSFREFAATQCGHVRDLKKNELYVGSMLAEAWRQGHKPASLVTLCESILAFGASAN